MKEKINHPSHYNIGSPEVIDIIDHWGIAADFDAGNVLKHFLRAPHKGKDEEDYRKAMWYLERIYDRREIKSQILYWDKFSNVCARSGESKLNLDWLKPVNMLDEKETTIRKVIDGWGLSGNRQFFIEHFHYKNFHCEACIKSLSDLIDEVSDGSYEE